MDSDFLPTRSTLTPPNPDSVPADVLEDQPHGSNNSGIMQPEPFDPSMPSTSGADPENLEPVPKRKRCVAEVKTMWNLIKIFRNLGMREQAVTFAEEQELIEKAKMCSQHKKPMSILKNTNNTVGSFICLRGKCRNKTKVSRAKNTWFENVRISITQVFYLMYAYANKWSYDMTIKEDYHSDEQCLSKATMNDWFTYCREAVVLYQIHQQNGNGKIGGPGKIVQIDESKFGKRKYNKGRHIEGHWVLGMIEDGSEDLRLEVCNNNVRSAEVLVPLIKKHVAEGTIIHTDYWRAYDCLGDHGYIHKKVNHSDPDNPFVAADGTHTQRIESQWRVVKRFFQKDNFNNRKNFSDIIYEYLWRRNNENQRKDPFEELIKVVKYVYNKR